MGANQSSNASSENDNETTTTKATTTNAVAGASLGGESLAMTNSPLSLSSASSITPAHGQQKYSTLLSPSPKSPKDLFIKRKSISSSTNSSSGKTTVAAAKGDASSLNDHPPASTMESMARGAPTRSSILRGSFRRVKVLNNVPPPVIPDEKFNRLSNVSLGSSSGFGSSQESTASSDSASSSTLSSFAPQSSSTVVPSLKPCPTDSSTASRKTRMNLRLNIIPNNPPLSGHATTLNGSYDNPYGTTRFNQPRSPLTSSPLASPLFYPGSDSLRSPQSSSESPLRRNDTIGRNIVSPSSTFRPTQIADRDLQRVMMGNCDSLKSPTRSDYVELMCATNGHTDSRHSRSSFSSFDGSNYSSSSFSNSPNGSTCQMLDVAAMFQAGMNDNEVLSAWLGSIGFTEYFTNFIQAGYDMPSVARMTTEDLTAIGITKPNHRKRIRAEIGRLPNVDLNFGCDLPESAAQFLQAIGFNEYFSVFVAQHYTTCDKILNLTWEDLEDIGIRKLGHLKKFTLAIKYFRALRRQTAQSSVMEAETKRFSTGSYMSQDSHLGSNLPDDDKSSASRSSLSSPKRSLLEKKSMQQQPVLTTFQAPPAPQTPQTPSASAPSPNKNSEIPWRPRSALGRHPSPIGPRTPDSEEITHSWAGSNQKISSPTGNGQSDPNLVASSLTNGHCTLPRRKSVKSGAGKSIAKIMAQVFRSEKGSSAPSSPNKDQMDSSPVKNGDRNSTSSSHGRVTPLASFVSNGKLPPPVHRPSPPKSRSLHTPDFNELARFPAPPSPLLRELADLEKTPTLPHRNFACNSESKPFDQQQQQQQQQQHPLPRAMPDFNTTLRDDSQRPPNLLSHQTSMPFAQDNIGTIKQRSGRNVPSMSSLIFRQPSLSPDSHHRNDHTSEEVLDEITGMLASLSDELDVAMCQLENASH